MTMPPQSKKYMAGYEPVYTGGRRPGSWVTRTPDLSTFPPSRTVIIRRQKDMDLGQQNLAILRWLEQMNMKVKEFTEAMYNGKKVDIAVLSSAKKAAIFKLAWG